MKSKLNLDVNPSQSVASPPLRVDSSVHPFTRTMTGVSSSSMHDEYVDDMSVKRGSSMCLSRAFSVSVDSENDARSIRSTFAVANLNSRARIDAIDDGCMHS
jgi:hypothetical protein